MNIESGYVWKKHKMWYVSIDKTYRCFSFRIKFVFNVEILNKDYSGNCSESMTSSNANKNSLKLSLFNITSISVYMVYAEIDWLKMISFFFFAHFSFENADRSSHCLLCSNVRIVLQVYDHFISRSLVNFSDSNSRWTIRLQILKTSSTFSTCRVRCHCPHRRCHRRHLTKTAIVYTSSVCNFVTFLVFVLVWSNDDFSDPSLSNRFHPICLRSTWINWRNGPTHCICIAIERTMQFQRTKHFSKRNSWILNFRFRSSSLMWQTTNRWWMQRNKQAQQDNG